MTNPYAPPDSASETSPELSKSALGELVKGWEKQRLIYNGIVLIPGIIAMIFVVRWTGMDWFYAVLFALAFGIGANIAFFAGPVAELYLRVLFFRSRPFPILRRLLLIGGLLISFGAMALFTFNAWFQAATH
jgi:hypothetical protein